MLKKCLIPSLVFVLSPVFCQAAVTIDTRQYITQPTSGFHLCSATEIVDAQGTKQCLDGRWIVSNGKYEFMYSFTNGIVDYFGRDSNQPYAIGVVRNQPEPGISDQAQRCFANWGMACGAPSTRITLHKLYL